MNAVKEAGWMLLRELSSFGFWLVANIPHGLGARIRALVLPLILGHLGRNTVVQSGMRITHPKRVSIGSNCNVGQDVFITGGGGVRIGDWVGLGPDVKIWSVNHRFDDPDRPWLLQGWELKEVVIEDDVWLGAGVFVMAGVTIGKGAIISAGTVLNKTVPPYSVVAGNPGRVIGWRKHPDGMTAVPSPPSVDAAS